MFEFFPDNKSWSFTSLRLLAESYYGGGEFNECYRTLARMKSGDPESWHREWLATAQSVEEMARREESSGHAQTAMKAYFRAANYYRNAEFFLPHTDERKLPTYKKSVECFRAAARLHGSIEVVEVPFENTPMPGYFLRPAAQSDKPPVQILMGGADSTAEELYFLASREAVSRGMACIIVDGPGRGGMLRLKKVLARPDYEKPIGAIIDYLTTRGDVDKNRIALFGLSMGGYYVARAAAYEKRVKACVVHFGAYDALSEIYDFYPPLRGQFQWIVGADSEAETRKALSRFTLEGSAERIECPLLILHGEDDIVTDCKGAKRLFAEARCEKQLRLFESGEPGSTHCAYDNHAEVFPFIHDWLRDRLAS
ncbi:MAG: alpha/beta hydrolase family protein [Candidatus Binatia bacterium]